MVSSSIRGLILGLAIGFVLGHLVTSALPPLGGSGDQEGERLRRQIDTLRHERDGLQRNMEEFRKVAERMTEAFGDLEKRFRALEGRLEGGNDDSHETPTVP